MRNRWSLREHGEIKHFGRHCLDGEEKNFVIICEMDVFEISPEEAMFLYAALESFLGAGSNSEKIKPAPAHGDQRGP